MQTIDSLFQGYLLIIPLNEYNRQKITALHIHVKIKKKIKLLRELKSPGKCVLNSLFKIEKAEIN